MILAAEPAVKSVLVFVEDSCRAFAALFLLGALAPAMASPADVGDPPGARTAVRVALGVLAVSLLADGWRASRVPLRGAHASLRALGRLVAGRGLVGRWYRLAFHEPLVPPDQARQALARLCGYRLVADGYRITSLRPTLRRGRLGVLVTVARPSRAGRRWACLYTRRVEDPYELWLLRSALQPTGRPVPTPPVRRRSLALELMSGEEIDALLRGPDAGAEGDDRALARRSPMPPPDLSPGR